MPEIHKIYHQLQNRIVILGFGCIGQAVLPLIFRHIQCRPEQVVIISKDAQGEKIAAHFGISIQQVSINEANYQQILGEQLQPNDFLLNLSVEISSADLIQLCQEKEALYLDASMEPWAGQYTNPTLSLAERTNYSIREAILELKPKIKKTAVLSHGANPGLVSHFTKQALWQMAKDNHLTLSQPQTSAEWSYLSKILGIKAIHIAERDTQLTSSVKRHNEFVNTWSVDGLVSEAGQPAELGWGTHERHWPKDAFEHTSGCKSAIYLGRPGGATKVRTWTPTLGPFHGFLITHAESISIANYLSQYNKNQLVYRPTVHYAYLPCPDTILSLHEFESNNWYAQANKRIIFDEIIDGFDELGVLLMGNEKGAFWYGSHLSIHEARQLAPYNNATSLQVAAGILGGLLWALKNPNFGIIEPEEMDFQYIMDIATPYLGRVHGYYTDWTPIQQHERRFHETLDKSDPWQFMNIRVGSSL